MHHGCRTSPYFQVISSSFQLLEEIGIFIRTCRIAGRNATLEIGGAMLPDVLVRRAIEAIYVGGKFREQGETFPASCSIFSEDYYGGVAHAYVPNIL